MVKRDLIRNIIIAVGTELDSHFASAFDFVDRFYTGIIPSSINCLPICLLDGLSLSLNAGIKRQP